MHKYIFENTHLLTSSSSLMWQHCRCMCTKEAGGLNSAFSGHCYADRIICRLPGKYSRAALLCCVPVFWEESLARGLSSVLSHSDPQV